MGIQILTGSGVLLAWRSNRAGENRMRVDFSTSQGILTGYRILKGWNILIMQTIFMGVRTV